MRNSLFLLSAWLLMVVNPQSAIAQMDFLGLDEAVDEQVVETQKEEVTVEPDKEKTADSVAETVATIEEKNPAILKGSLTVVKSETKADQAEDIRQKENDFDDFMQENNVDDIEFDERKNVMNEYLQGLETADKAQKDARDILSKKPNILSLRQNQIKMIEEGDRKRKEYEQKKAQEIFEREVLSEAPQKKDSSGGLNNQIPANNVQVPVIKSLPTEPKKIVSPQKSQAEDNEKQALAERFEGAPFGLYWDASKEETEALGFKLEQAEREEYQNVYEVKNPKQNKKTFARILAVFGSQNHLYCIYAQSALQNDDNKAGEGLRLYHQYYKALEQKYGNAKEFFSPNVIALETDDKEKSVGVVEKSNPIGNDDFLQELAQNKATLYATFESESIGAVIDLLANDKQQSYITIDYKNLPLLQKEKEGLLNELISDI